MKLTHLKVRIVEEGLEVRDIVEAEVVVGDDDGPGVGDLLLGVGHQHAARARLHVGLGVAVALAQAPAQHGQWSLELETNILRRLPKVSKSRRRPLLGPAPG